MNTTRLPCPLAACDWAYTHVPLDLSLLIDPQAMQQREVEEVDRIVREHYQTHGWEDWIGEISRLNLELGNVRAASAPLLCVHCVLGAQEADRRQLPADERAPVYTARFVINGMSFCDVLHKVQVPGAGGIIVAQPGAPLPPFVSN